VTTLIMAAKETGLHRGKITLCFSVISKESSLWQILVICNQILLSRTIEKCIEIVKRIC